MHIVILGHLITPLGVKLIPIVDFIECADTGDLYAFFSLCMLWELDGYDGSLNVMLQLQLLLLHLCSTHM